MGALDKVFRGIASTLTKAVLDELWTVKVKDPGYAWQTGASTPPPEQSATVRALKRYFSDKLIDGTRIRQGDFKILVAAKDLGSVVPAPIKCLVLGPTGTEYKIENVSEIGADEPATYTLHLRGPAPS